MKKCSKCGFEADTNFCPNCGASMVDENEQNSQERKQDPKSVEVNSNQEMYHYETSKESERPENYSYGYDNRTQGNPPAVDVVAKEKLSSKTWWIILWLVIFWPVGLFLMWKNKKWSKSIRLIITIAIAVLFIVGCIAMGDSDSNIDSSSNDSSYEAEEEETEPATEPTTEAVFSESNYTEIAYNDLARNPDNYKGEKIKGSGKVIQVIEDDSEVQLRIAIGGDYDHIILVGYNSSIVTSRVLEDDNVTYYGTSMETITYESTMGGNITVPAAYLDKIVIN